MEFTPNINRSTNSPGTDIAIYIKDLYKSFGDKHILNGFNLTLKHGENVVVLGKSGSGKSVLIKCIIGLIPPDKGEIEIFGQNTLELPPKQMNIVRSRMGFLFQSNALYDSMTVRENLEFPLRRLRISESNEHIDEMVKEALTNVGLPDAIDLMPAELSGGMKKRVSIARTLIMKPDIVLYDEPTTGLDPITAKEITNLMLDVQKIYNISSIVISHDIRCIQLIADRIVILIDGINYAQGSFEELSQSEDERVKAFFL